MIQKTINTIRSNPKVLLVFGTAILLMGLSVSAIALLSLGTTLNLTEMDYRMGGRLFLSFLGYFGIMLLFGLAVTMLVWPALGNYIYEMCSGKLEKGWYGRGLRRNWWKLPLLALIVITIMTTVFMVIGLIVNVLLGSIILSVLFYLVFMLTFYVYSVIAATAVFSEDEFSYALKNVFSLGSRYFFKLLGVIVVVSLPGILISLFFSLIRMYTGFVIESLSVMYFISLFVNLVYGLLATVFILTYSMHRYLDERSIYYPSFTPEVTDEGKPSQV